MPRVPGTLRRSPLPVRAICCVRAMVGKAKGVDRLTIVATASCQSPTSTPQPMELIGVSWNQSSIW